MKRFSVKQVVSAALLFVPVLAAAQDVSSQAKGRKAIVVREVKHDTSPPLRDIPNKPDRPGDRIRFHLPVPPNVNGIRTTNTSKSDPAAQRSIIEMALPAPVTTFEAIGETRGDTVNSVPPDTVGDVGPNHYVQWVNTRFAVFSRAGVIAAGFPKNGNTLWTGFGGKCETTNDGDPIVIYDQASGRWVMNQFTADPGPTYFQCVAISVNGDPTGSYHRYAFQWPANLFPDYQKLGVWPDGYYIGANQFQDTNADNDADTFAGAGIAVLDRAAMLTGAAATMLYVNLGASYGSVFPSDWDGSITPPSGSPNVFLGLSTNSVLAWKFATNWSGTPTATVTGPFTIPTSSFLFACGSCVPQPGTGTTLDTLTGRPMFRNQYRNFGDHESWIISHTVDVSGTGTGQTGIRWYELRGDAAGTPTMYQQSTFTVPDGTFRWMPSAAMNRFGDIAIGYSVSNGTTVKPGIRYTGRSQADPLSTMQTPEITVVDGTGVQTTYNGQPVNRWGDYAAMNVDVVDDCRFWFTTEYRQVDGVFSAGGPNGGWSTKVTAFNGPSCATCTTVPNTPVLSSVTASAPNQVTLSWTSAGAGLSYNVYRSANGCAMPYTKVATTAANATSYNDTGVIGGETYGYIISAVNAAVAGNCEGNRSSCVIVATHGDCALAPTFGGATSVTPIIGSGSCGLRVSWNAGTSNCPSNPTVTYTVYRSTTNGILGSAIASCISGTTYDDLGATVTGTRYYYTVRAEDGTSGHGGGCNTGNQDTNTTQVSEVGGARTVVYSKDWETGTGLDTLTAVAVSGNATDWRGIQTCFAKSGTKTFRFGGVACNATYGNNGGNGLTADARTGNIAVPAATSNSRLSFWHRFDFESDYDGARLLIQVNGGTITAVPNSAIISNGYNDATFPSDPGCLNPGGGQNVWSGFTSPYINTIVDLDAACDATGTTGGCANKNVNIIFRANSDCATEGTGWFIDDVQLTVVNGNSCSAAAATTSPVQVITATAGNGQAFIEWINPVSNYGGTTRLIARTDRFATNASDGTANNIAGVAGGKSAVNFTGLTNNTTYYFTVFASNGSGAFSAAKQVTVRPQDLTGAVKWVYNTGAASMTPPGVGSVYAVSNDRFVHSMNVTDGRWPTSPSAWRPLLMNAPSQSRPPVPTVLISGTPTKVVYVGSQDGNVYAINANSGAQIWSGTHPSAPSGSLIQGAVGGMFTNYGAPFNLVFAGTRHSSSDNSLFALDAATGAPAWNFNNGGGANGIGVISGDPWVSYADSRVYFTSRTKAGGSSGTLWCASFNGSSASLCPTYPKALGDIDGSPTIFAATLYVGSNNGTVFALNPTTGVQLWSFASNDGPVKGFITPDFTGATTRIYFTTTNKVWAVNTLTGTAVANWPITSIASPSIPLFTGTELYVGSSDGKLYQLSNLTNASPTITSVTLGTGTTAVGSPSLDYTNSRIYVGTDGGQIYATSYPLP